VMKREQSNAASRFHQPRAVWAVALACVVSLMGIGLVDSILPAPELRKERKGRYDMDTNEE
jgi:hypothetical protein